MILRTVRLALEFVAGTLVGAAILVSLLAWRLSTEPLSLAFLTPYFERALTAEDGSFKVRFDDTVLAWAGWERALDLRLTEVRAIGPKGETIASVPEVAVSISARGLIDGIVAPTRLDILRPHLRLERTAEGEFALGLEGGPEDAAETILSRLVTDLLAPPHPGRAMGYLRSVSIIDAQVQMIDNKLDVSWFSPEADISLSRDEKGISGELSFDLQLDGRLAHFESELGYDTGAQRIEVGATFANIEPAALAAQGPPFEALSGFGFPVGGTLAATVDIDGRVEVLGFDLSGGKGTLRIEGLYPEPVAVETVRLQGRIEDDLTRLVVDTASADFGGPSLALNGLALRARDQVAIQGEAAVRNMPVDRLATYWPESVAADSRTWVVNHLSEGEVSEARAAFAAHMPMGDPDSGVVDSLTGTLQFEGVSVDYLSPMPQVKKVTGRASYTPQRFDIDIEGGRLGEGLRVEGGTVNITGLDEVDQFAAIQLLLRGPLSDVIWVVDHEPLEAGGFLGLGPDSVGGDVAARLAFQLPLLKDLELEQVELAAAANLRGVRFDGAALGRDLTQGALSLKLNKKGMEVSGDVRFAGIPARLETVENFTDEAAFRSRHRLSARVTSEKLADLGLDAASYLTGPTEMDVIYTVMDERRSDLSLAADLTDATVTIEALDWAKEPGAPGSAQASLSLADGRPVTLRGFALTAAGLQAKGSGTFVSKTPQPADAAAGGDVRMPPLSQLRLTRLAFGRNDLSGTVEFRPAGGMEIALSGAELDAAPFFEIGEEEEEEKEEEAPPPLALSAKVERMWVSDERAVSNARLELSREGEVWRDLSLDAWMARPEKEPESFAVRIRPEDGKRMLSVTTEDAGTFLRTFDYFETLRGGRLTLSATIDDTKPDSPTQGELLITDYRIVEAPILAELLTAASLTGIVNVLSGEGIGFTNFEGPFVYREGRVEIKEARAYGPDLGLTINGTLDVDADTLDLEGTLVPAYAINSILGNIPLVGELLTGERGSGVFAATYTVSGPRADPRVSVNPLSALAPGFLRNLFRIFGGSDGTAPSPSEDEAKRAPERDTGPASPRPQ